MASKRAAPKKATKEPKKRAKKGAPSPLVHDLRQLSLPGLLPAAPVDAGEAADPRAEVGKPKPAADIDWEAIVIQRTYEITFDPSSPLLDHWKRKFTGTREKAEKEAAKFRSIVRRPLKQYVLEDGCLILVYIFDVRKMDWHLRWRLTSDNKPEDIPMEGEEDPHGSS